MCDSECPKDEQDPENIYTFIEKGFQDGSKVSKVRILYEHKYHSRFVPGYHFFFYFPQKYGNISETLKDEPFVPGSINSLGMVIPP